LPSSTVTVQAQVSGQSSGQAPWTSLIRGSGMLDRLLEELPDSRALLIVIPPVGGSLSVRPRACLVLPEVHES
jgi:hypothetical protein